MNHYKSWSELNKQLTEYLCESLREHITYFLTRYHDVHNAYGRASIRLDKKELVCFSWINLYKQEYDLNKVWQLTGEWDFENPKLKEKWDLDGTYYEMDFLDAAITYKNMPIKEALESENYMIKIFAILDRRVGKRTLQRIKESKEYLDYPEWVKQFYLLRFEKSLNV